METKDLLNIYEVVTKELVNNLNKKFEKLKEELVKQNLTEDKYILTCHNEIETVKRFELTSKGSIELSFAENFIAISFPTTNIERLLRFIPVNELYKLNTINKVVVSYHCDGKFINKTTIQL